MRAGDLGCHQIDVVIERHGQQQIGVTHARVALDIYVNPVTLY
jgi:hypothetical protein